MNAEQGHRVWLLVAALVAAVAWACNEEASPPPSEKKHALGVYVQRSWSVARQAQGHEVHVVHEKVRCADCHRLQDDALGMPAPEACTACHEREGEIVHNVSAAREAWGPEAKALCTDCHDFSTAQGAPGAWECSRCHTPHAESGAVIVHRNEACDSCHRPHETPSTLPTNCVRCHEEVTTTHASQGKEPAAVCTTCHEKLHGPADPARHTCVPCHAQEKPTVDATKALFTGGHSECTGCHRPHEYAAKDAVGCRTCHEQVHVLAPTVRAHTECTNCHAPHDVRRDVSGACSSCHSTLTSDHPKTGTKGDCISCHVAHPPSARAKTLRACSSCHQAAASDQAFHAASVSCAACHRPHRFVLADAPRALCGDCHAQQVTLTRATAPTAHQQCEGCHTGLPHQPKGRLASCESCHGGPASEVHRGHATCQSCHEPHSGKRSTQCSSCHQEQHRTAPSGHRTCGDCHDAHSGQSLETCASCHTDKSDRHALRVEGGCQSCHRPHGPQGVATPPACSSCHQSLPGLHQRPGHQNCQQCHLAHEPRLAPQRPICASCHQNTQQHYPESDQCSGCHIFRSP